MRLARFKINSRLERLTVMDNRANMYSTPVDSRLSLAVIKIDSGADGVRNSVKANYLAKIAGALRLHIGVWRNNFQRNYNDKRGAVMQVRCFQLHADSARIIHGNRQGKDDEEAGDGKCSRST